MTNISTTFDPQLQPPASASIDSCAIPAKLAVSLKLKHAALWRTFDVTFDFWRLLDDWQRIDVSTTKSIATSKRPDDNKLTALLNEARDDPQALIKCVSEGIHRVLIPVQVDGEVVAIATQTFETDTPQILECLATSYLREACLRNENDTLCAEMDSYVTQLTHDFEELTFMRRMAEELAMSTVSDDITQLSKRLFPLLVESIEAQSILLLPSMPADDGTSDVGASTHWFGQQVVDLSTCADVVRAYREGAKTEPVVKNRLERTPEGARFPSVDSFILVEIATEQRTFGWVLAVNRLPNSQVTAVDRNWQLSDNEFGTSEAGLLNSAASILATHSTNAELFREKEQLMVNVVQSLVSAIEAKDPYTSGHSERVALYSQELSSAVGLDEEACDRIYLTGLLHDIGKIGISDATLLKTERLTDEEFAEIQSHPNLGWEILQGLSQLKYVFPGVVHHHERIDGKGYPDGLADKEIPLDGRVLAIADAFDAMTSDRPYRKGMPIEKATSILAEGAGTQWDADIVEVFLQTLPNILAARENYRPPETPVRQPQETRTPVGLAKSLTTNGVVANESPS